MDEVCNICEGSGMRVVEREVERKEGLELRRSIERVAIRCVCRDERRLDRLLNAARIPERYKHCTLENYDLVPTADMSLHSALRQARSFVKAYPLETDGKGLLLTGSIGVGKTHLAIGVLKALITERGATGLFVHYLELLKQVLHSYNREVDITEVDVLRPVFKADVLVIDELGASKPTDWVWDMVTHIINTRYNDRLTTIITTNYPNLAAGYSIKKETRVLTEDEKRLRESTRERTLGDRIGDRMLSRLQEMCVMVEMQGSDFRRTVKRASLGFDIKHSHSKSVVIPASEGSAQGIREKLLKEMEDRHFRPQVEDDEPKGAGRMGINASRKNVSGTD